MPGTISYGRGLMAVGALVVVAGCASAPQTRQPSPGSAASSAAASATWAAPDLPPPCRTAQLRASYGHSLGAATGRRTSTLLLTNVSGQACRLQGTATVAILDAAGKVVLQEAPGAAGATTAAAPVTVLPGGAASEAVTYATDGDPSPGQSRCPADEVSLRVTLPGESASLTIPIGDFADGPIGRCPHDAVSAGTPAPGDLPGDAP